MKSFTFSEWVPERIDEILNSYAKKFNVIDVKTASNGQVPLFTILYEDKAELTAIEKLKQEN